MRKMPPGYRLQHRVICAGVRRGPIAIVMSILDVPGARLSYEVAGDGPLVVFIPGAGGEGAGFHPVAQRLASSYRVLTYDRRGFGASVLDGPQDYSVRLHTDADDVARLIRQEGGRAYVFGSSSGAIVALQLLIDHPEVVEMLLAHEPPAVRRLPEAEAEESLAGDRQMYETYRASGLQAAIGPFLMLVMSASDRATLAQNAHRGDPAQSARNFDYWFEHELPYYPGTVFEDARLKANLDRLVFVAGEETRGLMPHQVAETFAEQLGAPLEIVPGGHVGYIPFAEGVAGRLADIFSRRPAAMAAA